jgi:CHASE1-domain containing sensor protein
VLSPASLRSAPRLTLLLLVFVLVVGLSLARLGYGQSAKAYETSADLRFNRLAERLTNEAQRRVNLPVYGMKGARGLYVSSERVTRPEFAAYVASRDLRNEFPGVQGFGFAQHVPRAGLDAFLAEVRSDGAPDFAVRTSGGDAHLYITKYIYPQEANKPAQGFDIGSEPVRRAAIESAIDTGKPTLTGRVTLLQDSQGRAGFLYLLPVYRNQAPASNAAERRAAIEGFVFTPLIIDELFADLMAATENQLDVEVFDGVTPGPENLLLDADDIRVADETARPYAGRLFHRTRTIDIGGRTWTFVLTSTPTFERTVERRVPLLVGLAGTVGTLLIAAVVLALGVGRSRALALAAEMTSSLRASEERLRALNTHAPGALFQFHADPGDKRVVVDLLSPGFRALFGHDCEMLRRRPLRLLSRVPRADRRSLVASIRHAVDSGSSWARTFCIRPPRVNFTGFPPAPP